MLVIAVAHSYLSGWNNGELKTIIQDPVAL